MSVANHPFKPDPHHAAYIGLVLSLVSFGFAIAALAAAVSLGGR
jgi:hypothetical protein